MIQLVQLDPKELQRRKGGRRETPVRSLSAAHECCHRATSLELVESNTRAHCHRATSLELVESNTRAHCHRATSLELVESNTKAHCHRTTSVMVAERNIKVSSKNLSMCEVICIKLWNLCLLVVCESRTSYLFWYFPC